MEKSPVSEVRSIVKSKSSLLKGSDTKKASDEYAKKSRVKKVHFSDIIEVCVETASCSQIVGDDGSELSDLLDVPLNQRNMKKIQMLHTADCLNVEDFHEKYNLLNGGMALRQCRQKLKLKKSFRDFIGSQDFTAPLATMEEVDLFCDESPDSASNDTNNLHFMPEASESFEENHEPQAISGFYDSKDHLINDFMKNIPVIAVKEEIPLSETLNQHDEYHSFNTDDKNFQVCCETLSALGANAINSNIIALECPMVGEASTQNEYVAADTLGQVENVSNSLLVEIPDETTTEAVPEEISTDTFLIPGEDHRFIMTGSERTSQIMPELQVKNEEVTSDRVFLEMENAALSLVQNMTLSVSSPVAVETLGSGDLVTAVDSKEIELPFVDCSSISNVLNKSDDKMALLEDFVVIDEVMIDELEGSRDGFVIVTEVPGINEFDLVDEINVSSTSHYESFQSGASEELHNTNLTEHFVSADREMMDSGFVADELEPLQGQCLEQSVLTGSVVPTIAPANDGKREAPNCPIKDELAKFDLTNDADLQNFETIAQRNINSCRVLKNSSSYSTDSAIIDFSAGKLHENFAYANILCNPEIPFGTDCCKHQSNDRDSDYGRTYQTQPTGSLLSVEKQFKCILIPNLVWSFHCNNLQSELDPSSHYEESGVECEGIIKCIKTLKRQASSHNSQMIKTKKGSKLQKHR